MQTEAALNTQRNLLSGSIGVIVLAAIIALIYVEYFMPVKAHFHAGFQVYVDGSLVDFSGTDHMKETPCVIPGAKIKEDEQMEKAHLHNGVGNVVHSHRTRAKWKDLFINSKYSFDEQKPMIAYVNGLRVKNILNYPIIPYDSVIILVGQHGEVSQYLEKAVTKDQVIIVENQGESCGGS